ncbi:Transposon Tf2-8 polyprotein [Thelohanellus kitauei]|uniref:Transposon Tf2-8 polyprotein n=1 Tax=Thelohanellus kitauei TaxID=669202 RepID=A0A0C2MRI0_THEKT|nr:Transposon Tf2-8 polyprotein [Thelohanellus kitauei]
MLHDKCTPLYELTKKGTQWRWNRDLENIFQEVKDLLTSTTTLVHYDPNKELLLQTDASGRDVGAVLLQKETNCLRIENPINNRTKLLNHRQRGIRYRFGGKKIHQYLYWRKFHFFTDHKPLVRIFCDQSTISSSISARLVR